MCNRCLLDEWVNESVWGDDIAKDGALGLRFPPDISLCFTNPTGRVLQTCISVTRITCGADKHPLWRFPEPETRGPESVLQCAAAVIWDTLRCFWAWEPLSKGMGAGSQDTTSTALIDVCKFPQEWQTALLGTAAISSRKPMHYVGLQCRMVPCTSALADFSTLFQTSTRPREASRTTYFSPTFALLRLRQCLNIWMMEQTSRGQNKQARKL